MEKDPTYDMLGERHRNPPIERRKSIDSFLSQNDQAELRHARRLRLSIDIYNMKKLLNNYSKKITTYLDNAESAR